MRDRLPPPPLHPRVVNRRLQPRLHAWLEIASSHMHMHNARVAAVFKRRQYLVRNANQQTRECATDETNGAIDRTRGSCSDPGRGRHEGYARLAAHVGHAGPVFFFHPGPSQGLSRYENRVSPLPPPTAAHPRKKLLEGDDEI